MYKRLENTKDGPNEEMPPWDAVVARIQNFRYGATLQEWLINRKKKKTHPRGKDVFLRAKPTVELVRR